MVLSGKSSQECIVNAEVPQGSILRPTLFLLYMNELPDDVICNIAIYADDTTFYSTCDQASDLSGGNIENIWAHWFFEKHVPKAC